MSGPGISAVVLTLNEANHIVPCLRTLQWADEQIVVDGGPDGGSWDDTRSLAEQMGARVLMHPWDGWAAQRNFALSQARSAWVLFVDADERVPFELADEIRAAVARASQAHDDASGFWLPRQNLILGHWLRHAGWHPDYQLRLFRTDRGRYDPARPVHELVQLQGSSERLANHLVHHNYVTWRQFWTKQRRYARDEARQLHAQGTRVRPRNLVFQPLRELKRRYVTLGGYKAGPIGLQLSAVLAAANLSMYLELSRLGRGLDRTRQPSG
ncbi:MAG TPA: glycosyltransferase family 2 protein [Chloroflexota bacterium]|nr:glycosyltransferase family 2 protein [Chloroflexota bacterium]